MTQLQTIYQGLPLVITNISFLFVTLPLYLLVYYLAPARARPAVLAALSLLFYFQSQGAGALLLMVFSVATDYAIVRMMEAFDSQQRMRRMGLWFSVAKNIGLIIYMNVVARQAIQPHVLGLQIYTLSALGAVSAVYRREIPYMGNPVRFLLCCCFFPALYAGPLQKYEDFEAGLRNPRFRPSDMAAGAGQFVQGLFKTAVVGGSLFSLYEQASALAAGAVLAGWLQVFAIAFSLYFMLSGFSDMAQGLGALFGLSLPRNFYYPYQSRSIEDFFDRFHITVGAFIRRNTKITVPGREDSRFLAVINCFVPGILLGLWFGLRVNYALWGAFLALFMVLERYVYPKLLQNTPVLFRRLGTLCIVLASFTIFSGDTPWQSLQLIGAMFTFHNIADQEAVLYLLASNWLLLLISCLLATNAVNLLVVKFRRAAPAVAAVVLGLVDICILVVYLALQL